jgi:hypothetical protein
MRAYYAGSALSWRLVVNVRTTVERGAYKISCESADGIFIDKQALYN